MKKEKEFKLENVRIEANILGDDCPFGILSTPDGMYYVKLGSQIASKKGFNTFEDCKNYILSKPWELISVLIIGYMELTKNEEVK